MENRLKNHKIEANLFYEIKRKTKQQNEFIPDINILCYDFEKNLQIPKTNVSIEYYLSKFYLYYFGVHNLSSNKVSMFLYPENLTEKLLMK